MTCRTKVKYWSCSSGMVAQTENSRHCSAVTARETTEARRSASCSLSPAKRRPQRRSGSWQQLGPDRWEIDSFTFSPWFVLVTVQDQAVPGCAEHAAQLCDGEGVGVLADCGDAQVERERDEGLKGGFVHLGATEDKCWAHRWPFSYKMQCNSFVGDTCSRLSHETPVHSNLPISVQNVPSVSFLSQFNKGFGGQNQKF